MNVICIKGFTGSNGLFELTFIKDKEYPLITSEHNNKKYVQIGCFSVSYEHYKKNFKLVEGD